VSNFLDLHSRTNYDDFCLSYTFTYRDFSGGVVGLAWVASPDTSGKYRKNFQEFQIIRGVHEHISVNLFKWILSRGCWWDLWEVCWIFWFHFQEESQYRNRHFSELQPSLTSPDISTNLHTRVGTQLWFICENNSCQFVNYPATG